MSDFLEDTNVTQHQPVSQSSNLTNPAINITQRKNSDVGLIAGEIVFQLSVFLLLIQIEFSTDFQVVKYKCVSYFFPI